MFRASLRFFPPVRSQPSDGRTMSAPIMTTRELVRVSSLVGEYLPWRSSHRAGPRAQLLARGVGSAGQPAVLPGPAGMLLQPVQKQDKPAAAEVLVPLARPMRRHQSPEPQDLVAVLPGSRPFRRHEPGREPGHRRQLRSRWPVQPTLEDGRGLSQGPAAGGGARSRCWLRPGRSSARTRRCRTPAP